MILKFHFICFFPSNLSLNYKQNKTNQKNASPQVIKVLVANKCDLDQTFRVVDHEQAEQLAKRFDVPFYECSCKNNFNIQNVFYDLCHRIHDQLEQNENMFEYDGHINSMDIIKRLEDHQQRLQRRRSSTMNYNNNNDGDDDDNIDGGSTIKSCSNCVTNYYYNYNNNNNSSSSSLHNSFDNHGSSGGGGKHDNSS